MQYVLYLKDQIGGDWRKHNVEFDRDFNKGDLFTNNLEQDWYEVVQVVYLPSHTNLTAEVYAQKVDRQKQIDAILRKPVKPRVV